MVLVRYTLEDRPCLERDDPTIWGGFLCLDPSHRRGRAVYLGPMARIDAELMLLSLGLGVYKGGSRVVSAIIVTKV